MPIVYSIVLNSRFPAGYRMLSALYPLNLKLSSLASTLLTVFTTFTQTNNIVKLSLFQNKPWSSNCIYSFASASRGWPTMTLYLWQYNLGVVLPKSSPIYSIISQYKCFNLLFGRCTFLFCQKCNYFRKRFCIKSGKLYQLFALRFCLCIYVDSKIVSTMKSFFPHVLSTPIDLNVLTSPKSNWIFELF